TGVRLGLLGSAGNGLPGNGAADARETRARTAEGGGRDGAIDVQCGRRIVLADAYAALGADEKLVVGDRGEGCVLGIGPDEGTLVVGLRLLPGGEAVWAGGQIVGAARDRGCVA